MSSSSTSCFAKSIYLFFWCMLIFFSVFPSNNILLTVLVSGICKPWPSHLFFVLVFFKWSRCLHYPIICSSPLYFFSHFLQNSYEAFVFPECLLFLILIHGICLTYIQNCWSYHCFVDFDFHCFRFVFSFNTVVFLHFNYEVFLKAWETNYLSIAFWINNGHILYQF